MTNSISDEAVQLSNSKNIGECDFVLFPSKSLHEYFELEHSIYDILIDVDALYRDLISLSLNGEYTMYSLFSIVRSTCKKHGIKFKKKLNRNILFEKCSNRISFGGFWDYYDIGIILFYGNDSMKIQLTEKTWKDFCYELCKVAFHEVIHVAQTSQSGVYIQMNEHQIPKLFGRSKRMYDEMLYVIQPCETETFVIETILDMRYYGYDDMLKTEAYFVLDRALKCMNKYNIDSSCFRANIDKNFKFWKTWLKQK